MMLYQLAIWWLGTVSDCYNMVLMGQLGRRTIGGTAVIITRGQCHCSSKGVINIFTIFRIVHKDFINNDRSYSM